MKKVTGFIEIIKRIVQRFQDDNVSVYSAQTAFFVVMSTVPFIMLLISLVRFFIPDDQTILQETIFNLLPGNLSLFIQRVIYELFNAPSSSILSLTALMALWTASKGIMGLELGLHFMYRVPIRENYFIRRLRCTLYTFIFLLAIILAFGLIVLGQTLEDLVGTNTTFWGQVARTVLAFRGLTSVIVFVLVFALGYRHLTGVQCHFWEALPGILFATVGWMIFSYGYSIYITSFSQYTSLYGTLGALVLLFLWIYFCVYILMAGAEINMYLSERFKHH